MRRSAPFRLGAPAMCACALLLAASCSEEPGGGQRAPQPPPPPDQGAGREPGPAVLSGTRWKLVEIRGAEGGAIHPDDPQKYTFTFRRDGTLAMKLNCNRASTKWSADPLAKGRGSLVVETPLMTRAYCPPPTLDEQIANSVETLASYALDGERLHLGLASGAIYVLEAAEEEPGEE